MLDELDRALSQRYERDGNLEGAFRAPPVASPSLLQPPDFACPPASRRRAPTYIYLKETK